MKIKRLLFYATNVLFIFSFCVVLACPTAFASPSSLLEPKLECIQDNQNGTYTAHFGYQNNSKNNIQVPVGDSNNFSPGEIERGQTTDFVTGREYGAFKVNFDGQPLTWNLSTEPVNAEEEASSSSLTVSAEMLEAFPCKVIPITECLVRQYNYNNDQENRYSIRAYFGYYNPFDQAVKIPLGDESNRVYNYYGINLIVEDQPETFIPGRVNGAFSALLEMPNSWSGYYGMYWYLLNSETGADTVYATWDSTRECRLYPKTGCIKDGCEIEGERGNKTASFGYENKEKFAIKHREHDNYNELYPRNGCEWDNNSGSGYDRDGNVCNYPQPEVFEPGLVENAFSACYDSTSNYYDEGSYSSLRWRLGYGWNDDWYNHTASMGSGSEYCNRPPVCDAGSNYKIACNSQVTHLFLNGHLTQDPDNTNLDYSWTTDCSQTVLTGENTLNPILSVIIPGTGASQSCSVTLNVKEKGSNELFSSSCSAQVQLDECNLAQELDSQGITCASSDLSAAIAGLTRDAKQLRRFGDHWAKTSQNYLGSQEVYVAKFMLALERASQENQSAILSLPTAALSDCSSSCTLSSHTQVKNIFLRNSGRSESLIKILARKLAKSGFSKESRRIKNSLSSLAKNRIKLLNQIPDSSSLCL